MKRVLQICMICIAACCSGQAPAQAYPNKPIRMVVPFSAGGPADILGRAVGAKLGELLGQPVIIDNRVGAGGGIGAANVAKSAPDGYSLLLGTTGIHTINPNLYSKLPYDAARDFAPVSLVSNWLNILVVSPNLQVASVAELVALAKQKPGGINFASAGYGTTNHLTAEMLATMIGVKMQHVPYKGNAPALTDVIAGQITFMFDQYSSVAPNVKAGNLRAIGIATKKRHRLLPEVPTIGETVPGFEAAPLPWYGLFAPAGTPRDIVNRLNAELIRAMNSPEIHERVTTLGFDSVTNSPEEFAAQIKSELAIWAEVVKKSGARID